MQIKQFFFENQNIEASIKNSKLFSFGGKIKVKNQENDNPVII